jgi:glycerol-3-phosphate dehydrogenase (NAD(P)+)
MIRKLLILGAGSWGMTLATLACQNNQSVWLWDRKPEKIEALRQNRRITFPVALELPESVHLTANLAEAVDGADVLLMVVSSAGTRPVAQAIRQTGKLDEKAILVNASKGIEYPSLKRLSQVINEELPDHPVAVLSGPTLAQEILNGLPTAASVACSDLEIAEFLQANLSCSHLFRLYSNQDVVGVELGGSLKNVFAIVSGFMTFKQLGENARAALITRGLAEMTRFSVAMGAEEKTLYGMSGLGDLLATCSSPFSRNYQVGYRLAQGKTLEDVLSELKVVAEGVQTTHAVSAISDQLGVDMPIVKQVQKCLESQVFSEVDIIRSLMSRKLKSEQLLT